MKTTTKVWAAVATATFLGLADVKAQNSFPSSGNANVGTMGTTATGANLTINSPVSSPILPALSITQYNVGNATNGMPKDFFNIYNGTSASDIFYPTLWGQHTTNGATALAIVGSCSTAYDQSGYGALISIDARSSNPASSLGVAFSQGTIANRPLFQISNYSNPALIINADLSTSLRGNLGVSATSNLSTTNIGTSQIPSNLTVNGASTIGASGSIANNLTVNGSATLYNSYAPSFTVEQSTSTSTNTVTLGIAGFQGSYAAPAKLGDAVLRIAAGNAANPQTASAANNLFFTNQTGGNINFSVGTATSGTGADATQMQINGNGVAIGLNAASPTSTSSLLTVNGTSTFAGAASFPWGANIINGSLSGQITASATFMGTPTFTGPVIIGSGSVVNPKIYNSSDGTGYNLVVQGGVLMEVAKVATNNSQAWSWPDYVFDKNYKLRPVKELETYIKENHHLPEVPSAEEIQKEGAIDLADMDARILRKVEELTLYVIEIEKRNEVMQKKDEVMQKEIDALKIENASLKNSLNK